MRSLYRPCPSAASARVLALVSAALLLASCGSSAAGQSARHTATGGTAQQQIRVSLAHLQHAFRQRDFKRACGLLVPVSNPPGPPHVLLKPQELSQWEATCIDIFTASAKRGAPAGSFGKVQSIAVHGTTAEVFFRRTAAPTTFAKIAGTWRAGVTEGY